MMKALRRPRSPGSDLARRLARDESGAVVIIVAFAMVALLGLTALVIDAGGLFERDRQLQTVADAGALAGAQELIRSQGDTPAARGMADSYISKNVAPTTNVVEENLSLRNIDVAPRYVEVQLREEDIPFFFAPVIGRTEGSVYARARAEVVYVTGISNLFPLGLMYVDPDRFRFDYIPENGGPTLSFHATNPLKNQDNDQGEWTGGRSYDAGSYGTGMHRINLTAIIDGRDEHTWSDVGSWWVAPDAAHPVQRIYATRNVNIPSDWNAQLSESLQIRVRLNETVDVSGITSLSVRSNSGSNQVLTKDASDERNFTGTYYFSTPSMHDGYADIDVWINNSQVVGSSHFTIAKFKWFQRGEALIYAKIGPDFSFDAYSGAVGAGSSVGLSGKVVTKVLRFDQETLLKVSQSSAGGYRGSLFWADIYEEAKNLGEELEGPPPGVTWTPWGDKSRYGGDEDGMLEVGEVVGDDNGVATGQWSSRLDASVGKTYLLPIVGPRSTLSTENGQQRWWPVASFAAFRIDGWGSGQSPGSPDALIWGTFLHFQQTGSWSHDKPGPLYVETAVLTE
jgi:hypothetical protein